MSLMITGGGAPVSLSAYESEHDHPAESSSTPNNDHHSTSPASPSISISPFGQFNISPGSDGGVKLSHEFLNLHLGPTWSRDILGSSGEAHAGADLTGSGYVSVSPKDNVCAGFDLDESVGAEASATATAGPSSGTVGKDADKELTEAHIQVCTGSTAGHDLVAAADGIGAGIKNGLRSAVEAVPAIMGFESRLRTNVGEAVAGSAAGAGSATAGSLIARLLTPLLDLL